MKRAFITFFLLCLLTFCVTACGQSDSPENMPAGSHAGSQSPETADDMEEQETTGLSADSPLELSPHGISLSITLTISKISFP